MRTFLSIMLIAALTSIFVISCKSSEIVSKKTTPLVNTRWGLSELNGKKVKLSDKIQKEVFIIFKLNSNVFNGFGGCNNLSGKYIANIDGTISINDIISTKMMCEIMEFENDYLRMLETVDKYKISGDELFLYAKGKEVARFYAVYLR